MPEGKSAVDDVTFRGTRKIDDGDIEDKIATTANTKFLGLFPGVVFEYSVFDRFVLQRDLERVEAFCRTKGYYDVHARAGRIRTIDDRHVRVEIVVEEGEPVRVRDVRVDGLDGLPAPVVTAVRRAAAIPLRAERPFEEEAFDEAEKAVRRALEDQGYAFAKVTSSASVDIVHHHVDVVFSASPGPACVFGTVTIVGLGTLPEKPVRRAVDLEPGIPYSRSVLDSAQQALLDLGVFASVSLSPDLPGEKDEDGANDRNGAAPSTTAPPAPADASTDTSAAPRAASDDEEASVPANLELTTDGRPIVPIRVTVEPSRLHSIRLGGGVEFDALKTDIHGLIGWEDRNFFGGLRSFSVTFRPGVVLYPLRANNFVAPDRLMPEERLRVEVRQPGFLEARTSGFLRPQLDIYPVLINPDPPADANVLGYAELRNAIGVDRTYWKLYGALSYNTQVDYPFSYKGPKDPTLDTIVISYPSLAIQLDFRNDKLRTRRGILLGTQFQVAGGVFAGSARDWKVQPEIRGFLPLSRRTVLAARASVGFLYPANYGGAVSRGAAGEGSAAETRDYQLTFFRGFFSGGPNSNRGYPIRGVSPYAHIPFLNPETAAQNVANECGADCLSPTGGFTIWEASIELRHVVSGPFSIAEFCDGSDVSPQTSDLRFSHPHLSCGAGARYDTPVGAIRLDVGYRIPGLQVIGGVPASDKIPDPLFGFFPGAVHIGIGEAY